MTIFLAVLTWVVRVLLMLFAVGLAGVLFIIVCREVTDRYWRRVAVRRERVQHRRAAMQRHPSVVAKRRVS